VHKVPERLEVVGELPMTATGKIQKHLLRADIARKLDQLP
jgi:cyclohexanecarboxylate-CoA ligase